MTHPAGTAPPAVQDVLRQRARELARPPKDDRHDDGVEVLGFVVSGQRYAVPLADVAEVVPVGSLVRVPHAPDPVRGIAAVRGSLVAVFDLAGSSTDGTAPERLVVLGDGPSRLALVADELTEVWRLDRNELVDVDASDTSAPFVSALGPDGTALLDVSVLLASPLFATGADTWPTS